MLLGRDANDGHGNAVQRDMSAMARWVDFESHLVTLSSSLRVGQGLSSSITSAKLFQDSQKPTVAPQAAGYNPNL